MLRASRTVEGTRPRGAGGGARVYFQSAQQRSAAQVTFHLKRHEAIAG